VSAQQGPGVATQKATVLSMIFTLYMTKFQDLADQLAAGNAPTGAYGKVRQTSIALKAADWPGPLRQKVQDTLEPMASLEAALRDENVAAASAPAQAVNARVRELLSESYAWLQSVTSTQAAIDPAAQRAQVMAAIFLLDQSGFHELDEALFLGTLTPGALPAVVQGRIVVAATDWPAPLQPKARELLGQLGQLEAALGAGDLGQAAAPGREVHLMWHDLANLVYNWLLSLPAFAS
jgi:hypothetical protein